MRAGDQVGDQAGDQDFASGRAAIVCLGTKQGRAPVAPSPSYPLPLKQWSEGPPLPVFEINSKLLGYKS